MSPAWITAFLDLPAGEVDDAARFWSAVTGTTLSQTRGDRGQFATFLPPDGDPYLRLQRVDDGPAGVHLDLHEPGRELRVRSSPGGFRFCANGGEFRTRPLPVVWADGHASLVDQVCLDIPEPVFDAECRFWADLTGWELRDSGRAEFRSLVRPAGMPLRILLQRTDEADGPVRAHLDVATTDRAAEVERHRGLGARIAAVRERWTVMGAPGGGEYCITDRDPVTGLLEN